MAERISIILPHYKTWKMSFYTIHQLLKCRGRHQLDIFVVDNHPQDETALLLKGYYGDKIRLFPYPPELLQSHGVAYDWVVPYLRTEVFATIESDSFPTDESGAWLDWIELLVKDGYDSAGSCLELSGGQFVHTAGAFYKKSIWQKAKRYVENMEYVYFPNVAMKEGFPCHLMVHGSVLDQFVQNPSMFIQRASEYEDKDEDYFAKKLVEYMPIGKGVFHNGIGRSQEAFSTYQQRNVIQARDEQEVIMDNKYPFILRMGYEPGQFFNYYMLANRHKVYAIPTETTWMPNRENQQQEKTVMQNGFTHLWAITAYNDATDPALKDIIDRKKELMEELYNSIPANERI